MTQKGARAEGQYPRPRLPLSRGCEHSADLEPAVPQHPCLSVRRSQSQSLWDCPKHVVILELTFLRYVLRDSSVSSGAHGARPDSMLLLRAGWMPGRRPAFGVPEQRHHFPGPGEERAQ